MTMDMGVHPIPISTDIPIQMTTLQVVENPVIPTSKSDSSIMNEFIPNGHYGTSNTNNYKSEDKKSSFNPCCASLQMVRFIFKACTMVLRVVLVTVNNLYCIPTYAVWMGTLYPLRIFNERLYWDIEGKFFHWLLSMVSLWSYSAGYHILETGDVIDDITEEETLVLVNHQSTSDVPLLMAAFNARPRLLPNLNWIMDRVFQFTNFGIVSTIHGDFFVVAGKDARERTVSNLVKYLGDIYVPRQRKWLVLFPEGGFLYKRRTTSQRYAIKNNLPHFEHVTVPRMGAVQAIIDRIGPDHEEDLDDCFKSTSNNNLEAKAGTLKYVLDITLAYPNGKPLDIGSIVTGKDSPRNIHLHYRLFPISQVPTSPVAFGNWLIDRYAEKEKMLTSYYETGRWPMDPLFNSRSQIDLNAPKYNVVPVKVKQDMVRMVLIHSFFIASTTFHYVVGRIIFGYVQTTLF